MLVIAAKRTKSNIGRKCTNECAKRRSSARRTTTSSTSILCSTKVIRGRIIYDGQWEDAKRVAASALKLLNKGRQNGDLASCPQDLDLMILYTQVQCHEELDQYGKCHKLLQRAESIVLAGECIDKDAH